MIPARGCLAARHALPLQPFPPPPRNQQPLLPADAMDPTGSDPRRKPRVASVRKMLERCQRESPCRCLANLTDILASVIVWSPERVRFRSSCSVWRPPTGRGASAGETVELLQRRIAESWLQPDDLVRLYTLERVACVHNESRPFHNPSVVKLLVIGYDYNAIGFGSSSVRLDRFHRMLMTTVGPQVRHGGVAVSHFGAALVEHPDLF